MEGGRGPIPCLVKRKERWRERLSLGPTIFNHSNNGRILSLLLVCDKITILSFVYIIKKLEIGYYSNFSNKLTFLHFFLPNNLEDYYSHLHLQTK